MAVSKVAVLDAKNDGRAIHRLRLTPCSHRIHEKLLFASVVFATVQLRSSPYRLAVVALKLD